MILFSLDNLLAYSRLWKYISVYSVTCLRSKLFINFLNSVSILSPYSAKMAKILMLIWDLLPLPSALLTLGWRWWVL